MTGTLILIAIFILAYLIGSIPTAVWISIGVYRSDIRKYGSGNAGSTNMFRTFGFKAGMATQLVDIAKGFLAAALPWLFLKLFPSQIIHFTDFPFDFYCMMSGLAAVIGHIYPILAGFRGGKGVNASLGMILFCNPLAGLVCLLVFILVIFLSSYVSLGSMIGTLTYPVYMAMEDLLGSQTLRVTHLVLGLFLFCLVAFAHRENVGRLLKGVENRAGFVDKVMGRKKDNST